MHWRFPQTHIMRLGLALAAVEMIVTLVVAGAVNRRVKVEHVERSFDELFAITEAASAACARALQDDPDQLQSLVRDEARRMGVRMTVVASDGRAVADSEVQRETVGNLAAQSEISAAFHVGRGRSERQHTDSSRASLSAAVRMDSPDGQPIGAVRCIGTLGPIEASMAQLPILILAAGTLCLAATLVVFRVLAAWTGRSIESMALAAGRFAAGDFSRHITRPGSQELARLAASLNQMAEELDRRVRDLHLRENEQQAILRSIQSGLIALDSNQRIISMNPRARRIVGADEKPVRGRLLQEIVRQPELSVYIMRAMKQAAGSRTELRLEGRQEKVLEISSEPLLDARDHPSGLLIILDDVTNLRRLETMRTDFAANVSHELRTPITSILGYVETLLQDESCRGGQARTFLEVIRKNALRIDAIVEDLLSLTRIESEEHRAALMREDVDARELVGRVTEQFAREALEKEIEISVDVEEGIRLHVAAQLAEQALANLLSNAIRYSSRSALVRVEVRRAEDGLGVLSVIDRGPGIAEEHHARLFERFYRVDKGRSRDVGGTGLGLAIVKHIAQAHQGRVEFESVVGQGSTFRLYLPMAKIE